MQTASPSPHDEVRRPTGLLVLTTLATYGAFAGLPAAALVAISSGWALQRLDLGSSARYTPTVEGLGYAALVGVAVTGLFSALPAFWLGVRRLPRDVRLGIGIGLAVLHGGVVLGSTAVVGLSVLPAALDTEVLVMKVDAPTDARRAWLYRDDEACMWSVYVAEPLDPVTRLHDGRRCACSDMRDARVAWSARKPELVDPLGRPFLCSSPPSTCATARLSPTLGTLLLAAALARRRRLRAPGRAA